MDVNHTPTMPDTANQTVVTVHNESAIHTVVGQIIELTQPQVEQAPQSMSNSPFFP